MLTSNDEQFCRGILVDYGDNDLPADIGTIVNLICPPDLSLVRPNSIACTGNGEWEPDPSGVMCIKGNELIKLVSLNKTWPVLTQH